MIINSSRASAFQRCKEYAYNWDALRLLPFREADPLMIGEAWHLGSEILSKTGNVEEAIRGAEEKFRKRLEGQMILAEEKPEIEREIEFVKHGMREWAHHYDKADFKILMPEVSGLVPLPGTEHHCWFCHRIAYPNTPYEECPNANYPNPPGVYESDFKCWQPHHFRFRTDGIVEFYHKIYLLEQKTTTSTDRNHFWEKWNMDFQTGCYLYGIMRVTGLKPTGFLLNAIIKHSIKPPGSGKSGYKMQLDPTNVGFEREMYVFSETAITSWERELTLIADEYERAFSNPEKGIYRNTQGCFSYNRKCYYWDRCKRKMEGEPADIMDSSEFRPRDPDYVEEAYLELLGLKPKEETNVVQQH